MNHPNINEQINNQESKQFFVVYQLFIIFSGRYLFISQVTMELLQSILDL